MINLENPVVVKCTPAEKISKDFFFRLFSEADDLQCDDTTPDILPNLPDWYDDTKYKRAQRYFQQNMVGILASNLTGLICLLFIQRGVKILNATGRSSTVSTARRRYVSTILHTLSWYEHDLVPGSESWKSLLQVRKMHYYASKTSETKNIGFISQAELSCTQVGFMGLALVRPHIFGIDHDNAQDIEAFVHFWAVIGYMIGIKDKYNLCLHPVYIAKNISRIILRYLFLPSLQMEINLSKSMTTAMLNGLQQFLPFMTYEEHLFVTKRVLSVPGYQLSVDYNQEILCRSLFSNEDIRKLLELRSHETYLNVALFSKIPVFKIRQWNPSRGCMKTLDDTFIERGKISPIDEEFKHELRNYLELDSSDIIEITFIDYETEWFASLNNSTFFELDTMTKCRVILMITLPKIWKNKFARQIIHFLARMVIRQFRFYFKSS